MPRTTRRSTRNSNPVAESQDDKETSSHKPKIRKRTQKHKPPIDKNDSSSESDLESYLKPADQIDLSSSFFHINKKPESEHTFEAIEKNIFAGVNRLTDSESETDDGDANNSETKPSTSSTNKINFQQLHEYTKKLEEAKKIVDKYEAKKKIKLKKGRRLKQPKETSIADLLAKGEAKDTSQINLSKSLHSSDYESFSDSEKDWEEVQEQVIKEQKSIVPKEGVQITVELPNVMRKKKGVDLIASMKRRLNRIRKENQVYIHKVHLLCWLAHGNYVNKVLNNEKLLAMSMSLLPSEHCYPQEKTNLDYLEAVVTWFHNAIPITDKILSKNLRLNKALILQINRKCAYNKKMLVYIFVCMLRALGIQCRLVFSFVVVPLKPAPEELHSLSSKNVENKLNKKQNIEMATKTQPSKISHNKEPIKTGSVKEPTPSILKKRNSAEEIKQVSQSKKKDVEKVETVTKKRSSNKIRSNIDNNLKQTDQKDEHIETKKPNLKKLTSTQFVDVKPKSKSNKKGLTKPEILQVDGGNDSDSEPKKRTKKPDLKKLTQKENNVCSNKQHPKRLKKLPNYAERDSEDDFQTKAPTNQNKVNLQNLKRAPQKPLKMDIRNDIIGIIKGQMSVEATARKAKLVKRKSNNNASDYDSDYAPEPIKKKFPDSDDEFYNNRKVKVKRRVPVRQEENKDETHKKKGVDIWAEVYLESERKWISVDVTKGKIHCVKQLYSRASHPVMYVVAWNNNNTVKDITQRYCTNWNTVTRKLRIDKAWWDTSLKPYAGVKTIQDKDEDEELARLQLDQPLPKSISEYKDHPLYALKRHLLKFQAIYPPDSMTLGFIREEPVYARDCVHTLHSRETWLKHAKVVKLGEKPYKIVKARPKYDKLSGQVITDKPLEVFGKWQVEDYVPPTAKDGVVPRNAYGNVELFKACMLPKGTVHLQLPGLNKLAKKMNIDCVPAVVGFDIHSGWTHPTFDGFVVCEEFSESLIAAWYLEQEEQEKRDLEKIEKRVYGNWKKLIRGLLIRERLKARYDYGAPSQADVKNKKRKSKGPKLITKKRRICSESESD